MMVRVRKTIPLVYGVLLCASFTIAANATAVEPDPADLRWMQTALVRWEDVCRRHLRLPVEPLAWIIFYDENHAWHVGAEKELLPAHETATITLNFAGTAREVLRVPNQQGLWVPDRDERLPIKIDLHAAPYAEGKKAYCQMPLPSLFHKLDSSPLAEIDEVYLGFAQHELTHTRNILFLLEQIKQLRKTYRLPDHLNDNLLEDTFGKNKAYTERFYPEVLAFANAALADTPSASQQYLTRALRLAKQRHARYLVGKQKWLAPLDEIFLTLEGTAMWAQFQMVRDHAPASEDIPATFTKIQNYGKDWVQVEGMALFLLIDQLVPDWQARYFAPQPPSPFAVLQAALRKKNAGAKAHK